uniref:MOB kinase activator-like 1 n=1 Tax=Parastrongyloides trichosuri TaxID=131310 RepID=A0A0N5A3G6_PARTI
MSKYHDFIKKFKTLRSESSSEVEFLENSVPTLGSGSIKDAIKLPMGEDVNEWIAVNIMDFFNQITMLYGVISEKCTEETCPKMSAGQHYEYYWSSGSTVMSLPAYKYVDYLMSWVADTLDDELIFPSQIGKQFPVEFHKIAQTIMKRIFRIYAHVYNEHMDYLAQLNAVEHFNTSLKHFILFVNEFDLMNSEQMEPLSDFIEKILNQTENAQIFIK